MRTVGIIAEYNPFHRGHEYQIRQAREALGADWIVAAVSGDFVQRGEPAVFDKYTRTAMALSCGVDLVIELPSAFCHRKCRRLCRLRRFSFGSDGNCRHPVLWQ